jgi:hypothetical protein
MAHYLEASKGYSIQAFVSDLLKVAEVLGDVEGNFNEISIFAKKGDKAQDLINQYSADLDSRRYWNERNGF